MSQFLPTTYEVDCSPSKARLLFLGRITQIKICVFVVCLPVCFVCCLFGWLSAAQFTRERVDRKFCRKPAGRPSIIMYSVEYAVWINEHKCTMTGKNSEKLQAALLISFLLGWSRGRLRNLACIIIFHHHEWLIHCLVLFWHDVFTSTLRNGMFGCWKLFKDFDISTL